jgi:histidinol-phosphate aminotransferase
MTSREEVALYPDYAPVTRACEAAFGLDEGWLQLTNGLDEGLHAAAYAVARATRRSAPTRSTTTIVVEPAFEMYALCADAAGLDVRRVLPIGDDPAFPAEAALAALTPDVGLVYLTDPNNPSGLGIPAGLIARICEAAPQALVFVDEAYGEYSGRTSIGLLEVHRNLVVGRTFAKAYGLAGLRIGAVVAYPDTLAPLRHVLPPFPLNIYAVRALETALEDPGYLAWSVAQAAESREIIAATCRRLGVRFWPSEANFVLIRIGDRVGEVVDALAARGILIRDRSTMPGCAGCCRITAGVVEHTKHAMDVLEEAVARTWNPGTWNQEPPKA